MIDTGELIRCAKDLHSEDGENPEYDRALVELVQGVTPFNREEVARMLAPNYYPAHLAALQDMVLANYDIRDFSVETLETLREIRADPAFPDKGGSKKM